MIGKIIDLFRRKKDEDYQTIMKLLKRGDLIIDQNGELYVVLKEDTILTVPYKHLLKKLLEDEERKKEENEGDRS